MAGLYYMRLDAVTGTVAAGATFTNGQASVTGSDFTGLQVGDYIRPPSGVQWYKVTAIGSDLTIDPVFQQATVGPVDIEYNRGWGGGVSVTGTVSITNGSTSVSGTGTAFITNDEVRKGDFIWATGWSKLYEIADATTDNAATLATTFAEPDATNVVIISVRPFCHLNQYTTDTVRSAGDELLVQLGETHKVGGKDITFDEAGTSSSPIKITGSDWVGTGATANAIFDFDGTGNRVELGPYDFWEIDKIDLTNNTDIIIIYNSGSHGQKISNASITGGSYGYFASFVASFELNNVTLEDNTLYNVDSVGHGVLESCTLNSGASGTRYGIRANTGLITARNTSIGQTLAHTLYDIWSVKGGAVELYNCKFNTYLISDIGGYIKSYDHNQVKGAFWSAYKEGTIEKDTTVTRTGGASSSIKVTPNSYISTNYPLQCLDNWVVDDVSATEHTATIYVKSVGLTTTFPSAAELFLEAEYYDAATGTTRSKVQSTEVLTANDTWTALTVTFTPGQVGPVTFRLYLGVQIASEVYHIDNQLDLT